MTATIHHCEIFAWQKRQLAGEIYITGMAASTKGYVLTYMETPGMKPLNNYQPETSDKAAIRQGCDEIPSSQMTSPARHDLLADSIFSVEPAPAAVRMVVCPNCSAEYADGETCGICSRFGQIAEKARVKRRAWHLFKKGLAPRP